MTDGGGGSSVRCAGSSSCAGGWQERGDLNPVQLGATGPTSIAGLELLVSIKAEVAIAICNGLHAPETESGGFDLVGGFCFVVWDVHGSLYSLGRPGIFRGFPFPRPACDHAVGREKRDLFQQRLQLGQQFFF
jgi:hypothetical protein